jgi:uncharacterized protein YqiB (DUF1249 family)
MMITIMAYCKEKYENLPRSLPNMMHVKSRAVRNKSLSVQMAKWFQISELWRYFTVVVSTDISRMTTSFLTNRPPSTIDTN